MIRSYQITPDHPSTFPTHRPQKEPSASQMVRPVRRRLGVAERRPREQLQRGFSHGARRGAAAADVVAEGARVELGAPGAPEGDGGVLLEALRVRLCHVVDLIGA